MALLGRTYRLTISRIVDFGVYLDDKSGGAILLPKRYVVGTPEVGDTVEVFIYLDSEDRPIATTERPAAEVEECAYLKCVAVTDVGAFLDWGLPKDLFVPFAEQQPRMEVGKSYVVYLYIDNSGRLAASARLDEFLQRTGRDYDVGDAVDLFVVRRTQLGWEVAVDDLALGMVFDSDALTTLRPGMRLEGFVREVCSDGKLSLSLAANVTRRELADLILEHLVANGGTSNLTDKSSPDDIFATFGVSKRVYKAAIGGLYRDRKIVLTKDLITLVDDTTT